MVDNVHKTAGDIANTSRRIRSLAAAANCLFSGTPTDPVVVETILIDILDTIEILSDQANEAANNLEGALRPREQV